MDRLTKEKRSWNMSRIKSKNTEPELFIRHELWHRGLRYRKNPNDIYGRPDIYISKYRTAVFVHGCFWHRHEGCKNATFPKTNVEFWLNKFQTNTDRDMKVRTTLINQDIRVIVIWECTAKKAAKDKKIIDRICCEIINGSDTFMEF